jgi:Fe-S cluster assembly ATP-binding protein
LLLSIRDLVVLREGTRILDGLDLDVGAGEVHAIMGPNGSGKSTLASVLAGRDGFVVERGSIHLRAGAAAVDVLALAPEARARHGIFLAFQYPIEIPGVSNLEFLRQAVAAVRAHRGLPPMATAEFMLAARRAAQSLGLEADALKRGVNEGFSGGERKRNEVLQMMLLEPALAVLDETDSGLDVDALRLVADAVNAMRGAERSFILVTHYERLLEYIVPDRVHVLMDGRIARSGDLQLARDIEGKGYGWLAAPAA